MGISALRQSVSIPQYIKSNAPEGFRDELIYGEIIVSPEPKVLHFQIADNIYQLLSKKVGKAYRVAQRINLRFPTVKSMPTPDVFVITREAYNAALRSNKYPDGKQIRLVVEVVSPGNRQKNINLKVALYCQFNIETWVVSPKRNEVKIYTNGCETYKLGDSISLSMANASIGLAEIFKLP